MFKSINDIRNISAIKNNKGFTLVELMVSLLLVSLIIFMAYSILFSSGNLLKENSDRSDAQSQARKILQSMQKEIGTASSVQIIMTADPHEIAFPAGGGYIVYYSDGKNFYQMDETKNPEPAFGTYQTKQLSVNYTYVNSETLTINILANNDFKMETTVYARNVSIGRYPIDLITGNVLMIKAAI